MATANSQITSPLPVLTDQIIHINLPVSTKLDRNNFLTWKSQIEPIVNGFGLSNHLDGASFSPARTIDVNGVAQANPSYLAWHKQDQLLLGWLRSSLTESVLSQYVSCQTTGDLWRSLHRVYSAISKARIMELRRLLQTMTRGGQSCSDYFEKMRDIANQLTAIGSPVLDSDLIGYILNRLGPDYNSFVVAITTRTEEVTLTDLHGFFLSLEALLTVQLQPIPSSTPDPIASYTSRGKKGRTGFSKSNSHGPSHHFTGPTAPLSLPAPKKGGSGPGRRGPGRGAQGRGAQFRIRIL